MKDLVAVRSLFCAHDLLALLLILLVAIIYVPVLLAMLFPGSNVEPHRASVFVAVREFGQRCPLSKVLWVRI